MKTYILGAILSFGSFSAYSSVITGQGESKGIGGNVDCHYPELLQEYYLEAAAAADRDALQGCSLEMGTNNVIAERISDYENSVSCYYKGPWMSYSVITVNTKANYHCSID